MPKKNKTFTVFYETVKNGVYQCGYLKLTEKEYYKLLLS